MEQLPHTRDKRPVSLPARAEDASVYSLINHRYAIVKKLGEGGSGEVFLVADILRKNQRYAVKVLHDRQGDRSVDEKLFGNEVSSLVGLHHPNLVRLVDFGRVLHADNAILGRRFITMEYVEGTDLLTWCDSIGDARTRCTHIRTLIFQILSVLDYIHREGVIHYDIKPENLLVVRDESSHPPLVKLTDFGFSKMQSEENTCIRGTLEYTAPEHLRGDEHDERVDLYSLGATLYQLLEGVCPFRAESPIELIKKILNEPVAFSRPDRNTDSGLRTVTLGLLSRNPARRYPNAKAAARALAGGDHGQINTDFQRYLRPTFSGRVDELSILKTVLRSLGGECQEQETDAESPLEIQILGSDGSGKTALLERTVTEARKLDLLVIVLEENEPAIPFHAGSALLRVLYSWGLSYSKESREVARKVETLFPGDVATKDIATAAALTGNKNSEGIIGTIVRFFIEWSELFPFVLVLDNADRLDRESRMVIDGLRTQARPGRLLIIEAMSELPPALADDRTLRVALTELGPEDAVSMSRSIFGVSPFADELGRFLHLQYGGVPAVLVEAFHALANMPLDERRQSGEHMAQYVRSLVDNLPQDLDQFVLKRVRGLNRERQIIIEFLSCFRNPVRLDILESLLPYHSERGRYHRLGLESYGYIARPEGSLRCAIRQERLKAAVYNSLTSTWAELHGYIAKAMQHLDLAGSLIDLEELAFQLHRYGDAARASMFFEQAGEVGVRCSSFDHAIRLFREALECNEVEKSRARGNHLRLRIAAAQLQGGQYKDAIGTASDLLGDYTGSTQGELMKILGLAQSRIGQHENAKQNLLAALAESPSASDQLELEQELVGIDIALGNFAEAEKVCRVQLEKARQMANEHVRAGILTDLGIAIFYQDRFDEAASCFRESMDIYSALKRPIQVIDALCNIGNALSAKGDTVTAIEYWNTALQNSKESGTLMQQTRLLNNIGIAYFDLNDFPRAREHYLAAHDMALRTSSLNNQAFTLTNLGELAFADGEYEQALSLWTEALALYERMDDGQGLVDTLLQLGELHLVLGNIPQAEYELQRGMCLIEERRLDSFNVQLHYLLGTRHAQLQHYENALLEFTRTIEAFAAGGEGRNYHAARVRKAECLHMLGESVTARAMLLEIVHDPEIAGQPRVLAEAQYLLGVMGKHGDGTLAENPLVHFREGLNAITAEPVTEMTWRLSYSLGNEYHQRGHREKAHEFLKKARLVLQYFSGKFSSDTLREQYLSAGGRKDALTAIAAVLKP